MSTRTGLDDFANSKISSTLGTGSRFVSSMFVAVMARTQFVTVPMHNAARGKKWHNIW